MAVITTEPVIAAAPLMIGVVSVPVVVTPVPAVGLTGILGVSSAVGVIGAATVIGSVGGRSVMTTCVPGIEPTVTDTGIVVLCWSESVNVIVDGTVVVKVSVTVSCRSRVSVTPIV